MSRPPVVPAAAVVLAVLTGLASARIEEPRYVVTAVTLTGPATIPNGQSRQYTLQVATARVEPGAMIDAAQPLTGRVRPGLFAGGTRLGSADIDLGRLRRAGSLQLSLSCEDNEVRGGEAGSGAGARARSAGRLGLPWWDKPAMVRAKVSDLESNALTILCAG